LYRAEQKMMTVVDACTDCDTCRDLMDDNSCLFFPELYRLFDKGKATGKEISSQELRHLADLCNYCALCPCPNIREDIITAKTFFIDRDGLDPYIKTLEDVEKVGKICGAVPGLSNFFLQKEPVAGFIKKSVGIHPKRKLPQFPKEHFPSWAKRQKLNRKSHSEKKRKVAYFAGCTARYLFPDVPKAAVDVLKRNGIEVYYPEQHCCGMPSMLEGDRQQTLRFAERAVSQLAEAVTDGYDVVCSCPTCGYMLKTIIPKSAYYSEKYQALVGGDPSHFKVPKKLPPKWLAPSENSIPGEFKVRFGGHHLVDE
jgi:glycerol-3-phosphate dehydrogenase subunit C